MGKHSSRTVPLQKEIKRLRSVEARLPLAEDSSSEEESPVKSSAKVMSSSVTSSPPTMIPPLSNVWLKKGSQKETEVKVSPPVFSEAEFPTLRSSAQQYRDKLERAKSRSRRKPRPDYDGSETASAVDATEWVAVTDVDDEKCTLDVSPLAPSAAAATHSPSTVATSPSSPSIASLKDEDEWTLL